ncbi:ABC1 kinase family protein [Propionibacteriaceae bacterium Y2011]
MEALLVLLSAFVNALVLGFLARRLVGSPVGWPRTILLSLLVTALLNPVYATAIPALGVDINSDDPVRLLIVAGVGALLFAWVLVIEVIILVIAEAFVPTGSLPSLVGLIRGIPARRKRTKRYLAIIGILAKHGLAGYLRPRRRVEPAARIARAVREAMTDAGVTYVKLGQMLATRPDLLPPPFVAELSTLHSAVPAEPWAAVAPVIEEELGRPIQQLFAEVDHDPMAAASVAQIHAARLIDGTEVVIKVQRPRARAQAMADLDILDRLAERLERTTGWGRSLRVRDLADGFADSLNEELDYRVELANMDAVAAASDAVRVPTPYPELSGRRVLVMERMQGTPLSAAGTEVAALSAGQRATMAQDLFTAVLRQIMVSGVFHADLHPGNIFVDRTGRLALLDFGSVGRLDRAARNALGSLLLATERGDAISATDALIELLERPAGLDDRRLEREVGQLVVRYGGGLGAGGSSRLFGDLINLVARHRFSIPPAVAAAFRALGALEGSLRLLSPDLDVVATARAEGQRMIAAQLEPEAMRTELENQLAGWVPLLQRLPRRVNRITEQLEDGRLGVSVRLFERPTERAFLTGIVHQLILSVLAGALALSGVVLLVAPGGPMITSAIGVFPVLGATLLLFAFVLGARVLVSIFRQEHLVSRSEGSDPAGQEPRR